jgi:asparagine synthase (glutamine-hydrolysing)
MCGISGIFQFDQRFARPDISLMTNAIRHRGPDAEGVYKDESVSLGHRRLSIIDLSDAANQPFEDSSGRYVIVFNGEIYNYQEVKRELVSHHFRTNSDTEVILASFKEWGVEGVHKLKGMFVFVIWDRQEKKMYLFRDRMGVKPLYYYLSNEFFLFSSEIRGVLASGIVPGKLDRSALIDYFSFQSFSFPDSPVTDVKQLEAGSWMEISAGRVEKRKYWTLGESQPQDIPMDRQSVHSQIRELFSKAVERRLVSDVPVGAFLSGGIDSSAVVAMMAEHTTPVTFNISFEEEGFDESGYAALIARKYNTDHHEIRLTNKDFLNEIELALDAMDSPSADGINTYVVSKAIRNAGLKVALSGIGGDELFAGYPFFATTKRIQDSRFWLDLFKPARKLGGSIAAMSASPKMQRIASMMKENNLDVANLYPHLRRIITPEYLSRFSHLDTGVLTGVEGTVSSIGTAIQKLPILSQVSVCEYLGYTQNTLLKDADQMSMAVALEVREPFFDHDLISYVLSVPDALKYPTFPKSLLVESLGDALPAEIVHRKKQGFLFPWPIWMRNELREFCTSRIENICKRDFIKRDVVMDWWKRFLKGDKHIRWTEMWMLVVLEHWLTRNRIS